MPKPLLPVEKVVMSLINRTRCTRTPLVSIIVVATTVGACADNREMLMDRDRHLRLLNAVDSLPVMPCEPPSPPVGKQSISLAEVHRFPGEYVLTVIARPSYTSDTLSQGYLWLESADARHAEILDYPNVTWPLYGASNVDLEALGAVTLLYWPGYGNTDRPGVQGEYVEDTGELEFWFGAARTEDGIPADAGVRLTVEKVTNSGFSGTWQDAGRRISPVGMGYYCARRLALTDDAGTES